MKYGMAVVILAPGVATGAALVQDHAGPCTVTCSDHVGARQGQRNDQADAMLYWATDYLQARVAPLPTTNLSADTFSRDMQDVHGALMRICPNVPNIVIAEFMENLAGDFEKSAKPKQ